MIKLKIIDILIKKGQIEHENSSKLSENEHKIENLTKFKFLKKSQTLITRYRLCQHDTKYFFTYKRKFCTFFVRAWTTLIGIIIFVFRSNVTHSKVAPQCNMNIIVEIWTWSTTTRCVIPLGLDGEILFHRVARLRNKPGVTVSLKSSENFWQKFD